MCVSIRTSKKRYELLQCKAELSAAKKRENAANANLTRKKTKLDKAKSNMETNRRKMSKMRARADRFKKECDKIKRDSDAASDRGWFTGVFGVRFAVFIDYIVVCITQLPLSQTLVSVAVGVVFPPAGVAALGATAVGTAVASSGPSTDWSSYNKARRESNEAVGSFNTAFHAHEQAQGNHEIAQDAARNMHDAVSAAEMKVNKAKKDTNRRQTRACEADKLEKSCNLKVRRAEAAAITGRDEEMEPEKDCSDHLSVACGEAVRTPIPTTAEIDAGARYMEIVTHGAGNPIYVGEMERSLCDGNGRFFWPNGRLMYSGSFKNGTFDGYGLVYAEDCSTPIAVTVHENGELQSVHAVLHVPEKQEQRGPE